MYDLARVKAGDPDARNAWAAFWWPRVYRMALALCGRPSDAEDLAQETLVAALRGIEQFREEAAESTWLYAILKRTYVHRSAPPTPKSVPQTGTPDLDFALSCLGQLPEPQRIVTTLFYVEDLSVEEIAKALNLPSGTVRWRLFRARERLRMLLSTTQATRGIP